MRFYILLVITLWSNLSAAQETISLGYPKGHQYSEVYYLNVNHTKENFVSIARYSQSLESNAFDYNTSERNRFSSELIIWESSTLRPIYTYKDENILGVVFSENDQFMIVFYLDEKKQTIIDLDTKKERHFKDSDLQSIFNAQLGSQWPNSPYKYNDSELSDPIYNNYVESIEFGKSNTLVNFHTFSNVYDLKGEFVNRSTASNNNCPGFFKQSQASKDHKKDYLKVQDFHLGYIESTVYNKDFARLISIGNGKIGFWNTEKCKIALISSWQLDNDSWEFNSLMEGISFFQNQLVAYHAINKIKFSSDNNNDNPKIAYTFPELKRALQMDYDLSADMTELEFLDDSGNIKWKNYLKGQIQVDLILELPDFLVLQNEGLQFLNKKTGEPVNQTPLKKEPINFSTRPGFEDLEEVAIYDLTNFDHQARINEEISFSELPERIQNKFSTFTDLHWARINHINKRFISVIPAYTDEVYGVHKYDSLFLVDLDNNQLLGPVKNERSVFYFIDSVNQQIHGIGESGITGYSISPFIKKYHYNFDITYAKPVKNSSDSTSLFMLLENNKGSSAFINLNNYQSLMLLDFKGSFWLNYLEDGRYDCSPNLSHELYWVVGRKTINFEQLKDRFYEPDMGSKLQEGLLHTLRKSRGLNNLELYPKIKLIPPEKNEGKLGIKLYDQGGGYGPVRILVNGKEASQDARGSQTLSGDSVSFSYYIAGHPYLKAGQLNVIEVIAYNQEEYLKSRPKKLYYLNDKKVTESEPTLHAIVVGTADYSGEQLDLNFPDKDARSFESALKLAGTNLLGMEQVNTTLLTTDSETALWPTKENIKLTYQNVAKQARPNDALVLYFAGHGTNYGGLDGDFYYITADASGSNLKDPVIRESTAISSAELTEWIKDIPALKQVLIFDACHSGQFAEDLIAKRELRSSSEIRSLERLKDRTGMYILSGSAADAVSYEANMYGQGLLTYSLLFGMKGAALRENKFVDVVELFQFAADKVPELAQNIGGIQKPEVRMPYGGDSFDLGFLETEDKNKIKLPSPKPIFVRSNFTNSLTFNDDLKLSEGLDKELIDVSNRRGQEQSIIFIDARSFSNAFSIKGRYEAVNSTYQVEGRVFKGDELIEGFSLKAGKNELTNEIIEAVKNIVNK